MNEHIADPAHTPPPLPVVEGGVVHSDAEAMRRTYIQHEASIKAIGALYLLGFIGCGFAAFTYLHLSSDPAGAGLNDGVANVQGFFLGLGFVMAAFSLAYLLIGIGLRRLHPRARIPAIVMSAIGLLGFPIGTIISAYFLYLLACAKGEIVFSEEYREVIDATPHVKPKTSLLAWIILVLLVVVVVAAIVYGASA